MRRLPPELEELASGQRERLRRAGPRNPPPMDDPRISGLIPGVANRDARAVFDARSTQLERLARSLPPASEAELGREAEAEAAFMADVAPRADAELARGLCEGVRLGLWRAGRFTGFDAWADGRLGLDVKRARSLTERYAAESGTPLERLSEPLVALWLRAEAALAQCCPHARVEVVSQGPHHELRLRLPADPATVALYSLERLGQAAAALARLLPRTRDHRD